MDLTFAALRSDLPDGAPFSTPKPTIMRLKFPFFIAFATFLLGLGFLPQAMGQGFPLRSIDSIQWVHPDTLLTGKTLSRYVGDTVRVRGLVILNPRDHALSSSWKATYLVDTQNLNIGGWKGLLVRLQNLAELDGASG